ncbi:MAG TPA: suppressor of fused domain protein [Jatrophihabitans sp.]|nr:suppressor of fused domain protein [Jatrophihabitans sp.]
MSERTVPGLVEDALHAHFATAAQRASMSFVGVQPIDVLRFEPIPGERAYVTLGMSRQPMVGADELVRSSDGPRAELVLHLRDPLDRYADVWRSLAVLAAAPAVEGVVYRPGMTVDLGQPIGPGSACSGVLVTESRLPTVDTPAGLVAVLRVVPAHANELASARVHGAASLMQRWEDARTDTLDLARRPVSLR